MQSSSMDAEAKRMAESLGESEELFRQLAEHIPDMFWINTPDLTQMLYVSPGFERVLGYEREILYSDPKKFFDFIHPEDRDRILQNIQRQQEGRDWEDEFRILRPDGFMRWVFNRAFLIRNERAEVYRVLGVVSDITERKLLQLALQESNESLEEKVQERTAQVTALNRLLQSENAERRMAEENYRQAEKKYRDIVENAVVGISQSTSDGRLIMVNRAEAKMLGYDSAEEMMAAVHDITTQLYVRPEDRQRVRRILEECGILENHEVEMFRKDQTTIWLSLNVRVVRDSHGAILYYETMAQDITASKRMQEQLVNRARQQEAVARLGVHALEERPLQELMNEAASVVSETLGVEYCKIDELQEDEQGLLLIAGVGWRQGCVGSTLLSAGKESQAGYTLLSQETVVTSNLLEETRFHGAPLLLSHGVISGVSVIIHGKQRPFGVLGAHTSKEREFTQDDIHFLQSVANVLSEAVEGKRTENRLRQANRALEALIETSPLAIMATDTNGVVLRWNPAMESLYGWSASETLLTRGPHISPESESQFVELLNRTLAGERFRGLELHRVRKDGTPVQVSLWTTPMHDAQGKVVGIWALLDDITERKQLEREILEISGRERLSIGQDLHDGLGQDLTGIAMLTKVLEQKLTALNLAEAADATQVRSLVENAVAHAHDLAKLLYPLELERGGLIPALSELALNAEKLFSVSCLFEWNDPVPIEDHAVLSHLYRIAQEAVTNAVKHGKPRNIFIGVSCSGHHVTLTIKDDGMGIPVGEQADDGMGLRIMQYRARMIQGTLVVGSDRGAGTVVTCSVPFP